MSQESYRMYSVAKREADNFKDNLDNIVQCPTEVPTVSVFNAAGFEVVIVIGFLAFVGGFLIGTNHR